VKGFVPRYFFWRRATGTAIAAVISPFEELLEDGTPAPIGANELSAYLQRLAPDRQARCVIGICAPSGFTPEARALLSKNPNLTLVLVEPTRGGGWRVTAGEDAPDFVRQMFDPEDAEQKMDRVSAAVNAARGDLLTGGMSAARIAEKLSVPVEMARAAFERLATGDPELRVSRNGEDVLLYRGAPVLRKEKSMKGWVDRIRDLFGREGDEAAKINLLAERRAALAQRRDRLYEEIGTLEQREDELLTQGRQNTSTVVRRRLAAQIAQLRKDIARQNTTAAMLNQQINIIATDVHNLTLIQQGKAAELPDTQELTENAVRAEEMLESLQADADMVGNLGTGMNDMLASAEERDILAEFDAPVGEPPSRAPAAKPKAGASAKVEPAAAPAEDAILSEFDAPPPGTRKERGKGAAEAG
jgi:hypothetical protein